MKSDQVTEAEILKITNKIFNAFAKKDLDALMSQFLPDPGISLFGEKADGRLVGFDKIKSFYKQMFDQADPNIPIKFTKLDEPIVSVNGNVAWVSSALKMEFEMEDNKVNIYIRNTTVFLKQNEKWLVAHMHSSTPIVERN